MEQLDKLRQEALAALREATCAEALEQWRIRYLGAKGAVKAAMGQLKDLASEAKPAFGKLANRVKDELTSQFEARKDELAVPRAAAAAVDTTMPGEKLRIGHRHILTQTIQDLIDIFARMGFSVAYGPEVEDEWHTFDALNMPAAHPARDPWGTFYINDDVMLRTQTSTVQIRVMESTRPPIRVVAPGRVYRPDTVDATHGFMFHQIEGLYVDEGVTMSDLKSCLQQFCRAYFGPDVATRFNPSFFPFTEPSAELAFGCPFCHGGGCPTCKQSGWIELGGCGMVDPNVLDAVGYDSQKYTGFAFGLGIERMVMRKHGIPDVRLLFENDVRFLHQF
jgi:phenylalanyl-tRNA synthetase alpha chain